MSYEIAKKFWSDRKEYPTFPNTLRRRLIDVNFVVDNIENPKSVMDLGCADGYLLLALREFTNIEKFYGFDISPKLLDQLNNRWGKYRELNTKVSDFTKFTDYPVVDLTISMGMFPSIFQYDDLYNILNGIKSDTLIIRSPCTSLDEDEYINKYSDDLGENYSALYRTTSSYLSTLQIFYKHVYMERAYPDDIESKYGTKHFFFICRSRK